MLLPGVVWFVLVAQDFVQILMNKVTPCKGREMRVEMMPGCLDYKSLFDKYGLSMTGLVPNARAVGLMRRG